MPKLHLFQGDRLVLLAAEQRAGKTHRAPAAAGHQRAGGVRHQVESSRATWLPIRPCRGSPKRLAGRPYPAAGVGDQRTKALHWLGQGSIEEAGAVHLPSCPMDSVPLGLLGLRRRANFMDEPTNHVGLSRGRSEAKEILTHEVPRYLLVARP